jgi:hypothetical protein
MGPSRSGEKRRSSTGGDGTGGQGDGADGEPHCHLVALPPAALTVRSVSFRIEVRSGMPSSPYARSRRNECRWEPPREVRPRGLRGFGRRIVEGPGSAAELSQSMRPLALRARLAASLPLSIRKPMIVADGLRVVARMGAVRSPLWGMPGRGCQRESLRRGMHRGSESPRLYASGSSGFLPGSS